LSSLDLLPEYSGRTFRELPDKIRRKLQKTTLRTFELSPKTPKEMMFMIFERLNTGGMALNEMEIRNCIYSGPLLKLIEELAGDESFVSVIDTKDIAKRMDDRALVLRFLAFHEKHYSNCKKGIKAFLNDFCDVYRNSSQSKLTEFRKQFTHSMKAAGTIFGKGGFRLRKEVKDGLTGWGAKVNASVFQVLSVSFTDYSLAQITRRRDSIYEAYVNLVSSTDAENKMWVDYTKTWTGDYSRIDYVFSVWNQILKDAIGDEEPNDPHRCFSLQLKKQLYEQNPTCAICGQKIAMIEDAEVDHIEHYWKGGKTIPENARLAHRHCNRARSNT
jgi:hypothetical protein